MKIASSNPKKLEEYKKLFPNIRTQIIADIPEVKADKDTVILHKIKDIKAHDLIIEDTILEILEKDEWIEIVDIKYKIKEMKTASPSKWVVSLGWIKEDKIYIARDVLEGQLDPSKYVEGSFGFDSIFIPNGETRSLHELDLLGLKDKYNMRREAIIDLENEFYYMVQPLAKVEPWIGSYQS